MRASASRDECMDRGWAGLGWDGQGRDNATGNEVRLRDCPISMVWGAPASHSRGRAMAMAQGALNEYEKAPAPASTRPRAVCSFPNMAARGVHGMHGMRGMGGTGMHWAGSPRGDSPMELAAAKSGRRRRKKEGRTGGMRTESRACGVYQEPIHSGIGTDHLHVRTENVESVGTRSPAHESVIWRELGDGECGEGSTIRSARRTHAVYGAPSPGPRSLSTKHQAPSTKHQAPSTSSPSVYPRTKHGPCCMAHRPVWFLLVLVLVFVFVPAIDVRAVQWRGSVVRQRPSDGG
jgi:hypothetical protein